MANAPRGTMKRTIIAICLSSLFCGPYPCAAARRQERSTARDLYLSFGKTANKPAGRRRGRPGSKVRMELMRNNQLSLVTTRQELRDGDRIAFRTSVNYQGYLMVTNIGTSGNVNVLYSRQVSPASDLRIPEKGWILVTGKSGDEVVNFIMSSKSIQEPRQIGSQAAGAETQKTLGQLNSRALDQGRDLVIENDGD